MEELPETVFVRGVALPRATMVRWLTQDNKAMILEMMRPRRRGEALERLVDYEEDRRAWAIERERLRRELERLVQENQRQADETARLRCELQTLRPDDAPVSQPTPAPIQ